MEFKSPTQKERRLLRDLALNVRDAAETPLAKQKNDLWLKHNSLKGDRPLVVCSPEGAWEEIIPPSKLECEDTYWREVERQLKMTLYWFYNLKDDSPLEPYFDVTWIIGHDGYGVAPKMHFGENRGSYAWEPPITDINRDFDKLHMRHLYIEHEATKQRDELLAEAFGDILPLRYVGQYWWTFGLTAAAIQLIGLENLMTFMYDDPDGLHRLMAFLRDDSMALLDFLESNNLLCLNTFSNGIASGGYGFVDCLPTQEYKKTGKVTTMDLWGFAESQETVGISPSMFGEFIFPYQLPLLERFGLNCYGCCEPVHSRWEYIKQIPRLRRVSVSPWCNQHLMAEYLGKDVIFSRKPNPTQVCAGFDEDEIRKDLRETLSAAKDNRLEIIMKDTHTVQNHPERLCRWVEIAREEISNFGI